MWKILFKSLRNFNETQKIKIIMFKSYLEQNNVVPHFHTALSCLN